MSFVLKYFTERGKKVRGPAVIEHVVRILRSSAIHYIYIYESYVCVFSMYISLFVKHNSKLSGAYLTYIHFGIVHCTQIRSHDENVQRQIQGDSGGKVNILGSVTNGHCEKKIFIWTCV